MTRLLLFALSFLLMSTTPPPAQAADTLANLMVVLRESPGANKLDDTLVSVGKLEATLPDGRSVDTFPAWFEFLGDMQLRFVFDHETSLRSATQDELEALHLTPEQALGVAVANVERVYGKPSGEPWNGLTMVSGQSPYLDSSYFLDRAFWQALLKTHPEGLVVAVPKRGGLLYTPLSDSAAVTRLRQGIANLYTSSEDARISSALYLFKGDQWTVFQPATGWNPKTSPPLH